MRIIHLIEGLTLGFIGLIALLAVLAVVVCGLGAVGVKRWLEMRAYRRRFDRLRWNTKL